LSANEIEGLIVKRALAVLLESSFACTVLCPKGAAGTAKAQENIPFTLVLHDYWCELGQPGQKIAV